MVRILEKTNKYVNAQPKIYKEKKKTEKIYEKETNMPQPRENVKKDVFCRSEVLVKKKSEQTLFHVEKMNNFKVRAKYWEKCPTQMIPVIVVQCIYLSKKLKIDLGRKFLTV